MFRHKRRPHDLLRVLEVWLGLAMISLAVAVICDQNFFFWPPDWAPIFNSRWIAGIGMASGMVTTLIGLFDLQLNWIYTVAISVNTGFFGLLTVGELLPVAFIGYKAWHFGAILSVWMLAICLIIAYFHEPTNKH